MAAALGCLHTGRVQLRLFCLILEKEADLRIGLWQTGDFHPNIAKSMSGAICKA
jgi:hypothetical protein